MSQVKSPARPLPKFNNSDGGSRYEDVEHIVGPTDPDTALCGVDQTDVPWNQGFPPCQACMSVMRGGMN